MKNTLIAETYFEETGQKIPALSSLKKMKDVSWDDPGSYIIILIHFFFFLNTLL